MLNVDIESLFIHVYISICICHPYFTCSSENRLILVDITLYKYTDVLKL